MEILLSTARVRDLIYKGDIELLRNTIESSSVEGMRLFDQSLYQLFMDKKISEETAIFYADRPTDLKLQVQSQTQQVFTKKSKY